MSIGKSRWKNCSSQTPNQGVEYTSSGRTLKVRDKIRLLDEVDRWRRRFIDNINNNLPIALLFRFEGSNDSIPPRPP
jgi:hypothetical protein